MKLGLIRINRLIIRQIIVDALLVAIAFPAALFLRFDIIDVPDSYLQSLKIFILPIVAAKISVYFLTGFYNIQWRYATIRNYATIIWASMVGTFLEIVIIFYLFNDGVPRSVVAIDGFLTAAFITVSRLLFIDIEDIRLLISRRRQAIRPVLVFGAGETGIAIIYQMKTHPDLGYKPVGLIDDDPKKQGLEIHGVRILGPREQLQGIIDRYQIEEVIICTPMASREIIRDVFSRCNEAGVKCKTLPGIYQLIDGTVSIGQLREVRIEDILGREPVKVDLKKVAAFISGKAVLVTGAGGSIGSEFCRQIYYMQPSSLIMIDQSESSLFLIEQELLMRQSSTSAIPVVADINNQTRVKAIFEKYRPSIIFHAAAYKHVPLMETCTTEAIDNNLFGTKTVAETAIQFGAEKFIFISTDKAVEPISVMGISKALTEKLVQTFSVNSPTKFIIVRFGNVLDSSGSVVPIFRQQIAQGGPVTVTHPEMTRYLMTIPEAIHLVIQAAAMGQQGDIFVLDMGEQIPILELARNMIRLSGFEPDKDIHIVFTGIRPGEKLHEKLFWDHERIVHTKHEKILMAKNTRLDTVKFKKDMRQLESFLSTGDFEKMQQKLAQMCACYLGATSSDTPSEKTVGKGS